MNERPSPALRIVLCRAGRVANATSSLQCERRRRQGSRTASVCCHLPPRGADAMRRTTLAAGALLLAGIASSAALADTGTTLTPAGQTYTPSFSMTLDQPGYSPGQAITVAYSGFP